MATAHQAANLSSWQARHGTVSVWPRYPSMWPFSCPANGTGRMTGTGCRLTPRQLSGANVISGLAGGPRYVGRLRSNGNISVCPDIYPRVVQSPLHRSPPSEALVHQGHLVGYLVPQTCHSKQTPNRSSRRCAAVPRFCPDTTFQMILHFL